MKKENRNDAKLKLRPSLCLSDIIYFFIPFLLEFFKETLPAAEHRFISLSEEHERQHDREHSNTTYISISQSAPTTVSSLCEVLHCG